MFESARECTEAEQDKLFCLQGSQILWYCQCTELLCVHVLEGHSVLPDTKFRADVDSSFGGSQLNYLSGLQ
jgi:hypothetical protein